MRAVCIKTVEIDFAAHIFREELDHDLLGVQKYPRRSVSAFLVVEVIIVVVEAFLGRRDQGTQTSVVLGRCDDIVADIWRDFADIIDDDVLPVVPGKIFCDMTTTKPSLDIMIASRLAEKGAHMADAPVSGGDTGARNGTLSIMVGCSDEVFQALLPCFEAMGKNITHMGPVGSGQHTKMANQIVIAGTMCGVSEALVYGAQAGLDLDKMVSTISKGAAGCWTLDNLAPRVLKGDYEPGFMVEHFIKDMGIALEEAERMELPLPSLALARQLYLAIKAQGMGRKGTQVLVKALESLKGKEIL